MEKYVLFGGRLADFKYYNMDEVIENHFLCVFLKLLSFTFEC